MNMMEQIDNRIKDLIKYSIENKLDIIKVKWSEKRFKEFSKYIVDIDQYPYEISLNDDGEFSLEIKNNGYHVLFVFRKKLHFYLSKDDILIMSSEFNNIKNFFEIMKLTLINKLFNLKN